MCIAYSGVFADTAPVLLSSEEIKGYVIVVKAGPSEADQLKATQFNPSQNEYGVQYMRDKNNQVTRLGLHAVAKYEKLQLDRTIKSYCDILLKRIDEKREAVFTEDFVLHIKKITIIPGLESGHTVMVDLREDVISANPSFRAFALSYYLSNASSKKPSELSTKDLEICHGGQIVFQKLPEKSSSKENKTGVK